MCGEFGACRRATGETSSAETIDFCLDKDQWRHFTSCRYIKDVCEREGNFIFMILVAGTRSEVCMAAGQFR